jgi:predicted transcriptional regulator
MDDQTLGQKIDEAVAAAVEKINAKIDELQARADKLSAQVDELQDRNEAQVTDPDDAPHVEHR